VGRGASDLEKFYLLWNPGLTHCPTHPESYPSLRWPNLDHADVSAFGLPLSA